MGSLQDSSAQQFVSTMPLEATKYKGKEYECYSYTEFAVDDEDEWLEWARTYHRKTPKKELEEKKANFEEQQKCIYKLLKDARLKEARFMSTLEKDLSPDLVDSMSLDDHSVLYNFYDEKKSEYDRLLKEMKDNLAAFELKRATDTYQAASKEYHAVARTGGAVAGFVTGTGAAFGILGTMLTPWAPLVIGGVSASMLATSAANPSSVLASSTGFAVASAMGMGKGAREKLAAAKEGVEEC